MSGINSWPESVWKDFCHLFCGKHIGSGVAREVYEYTLDDTKVIKIEMESYSFQNTNEWQTWGTVRETKWAKYFTPCHQISPCGIVLLQTRTQPLDKLPKKVLPKKVLPDIFTDVKLSNFGILNGNIVAHDYGLTALETNALKHSNLNKDTLWFDDS